MGFSITDMLNKDTSMAAAPVKEHTIERISYSKLVPSEDNFYSMQEIEELKTAIELAGRVLNNLVVTPLEDGKYKILSGHRRHRAVGMLLDEGQDRVRVSALLRRTDRGRRPRRARTGVAHRRQLPARENRMGQARRSPPYARLATTG